jgi:hypothetical protein
MILSSIEIHSQAPLEVAQLTDGYNFIGQQTLYRFSDHPSIFWSIINL